MTRHKKTPPPRDISHAFLALAGTAGESIYLTPERAARKDPKKNHGAKTRKRASAEADPAAGVSR